MGDWGSMFVVGPVSRIVPDRAVYGFDPNFDVSAHLRKSGSILYGLKIGGFLGFGSKTPAEVVTDIAREYDVKSQYLLVTIDREQGLVSGVASRLNPNTEKAKLTRALDWAAGYGAWHGKPESAWDRRWVGFANQVRGAAHAAAQARSGRGPYSDIPALVAAKKPMQLLSPPKATVTPANIATALLYKYTPDAAVGAVNRRLFSRHAPELVA